MALVLAVDRPGTVVGDLETRIGVARPEGDLVGVLRGPTRGFVNASLSFGALPAKAKCGHDHQELVLSLQAAGAHGLEMSGPGVLIERLLGTDGRRKLAFLQDGEVGFEVFRTEKGEDAVANGLLVLSGMQAGVKAEAFRSPLATQGQ